MKVLGKLFLICLIICSIHSSVLGQNSTNFFADTAQSLNVSIGMNYTYGSNVMNNQFLNKFIFGGKINRENKDRAYSKLSDKNRLGGDLNYSVSIEIPVDTLFRRSNISLVFGIENIEHLDGAFSADLFKFVFDGNKQFAGESIDIGNTNFNHYKYQQFNFGLVKYKVYDEVLAKEGVSISIIKAEEHMAITVPRGSVFTEELGREIDVDLNYIYNASDTASKGIGAFNGYGISTDLFTEIILKNGDKLFLGVQDLGFIHWNSNSRQISSDSAFHFDGIAVNSIFDLNDSLLSNISKDSIINSISTSNEQGDYSIALPTAIHVNYTKVLSEKWKVNVGLYHKILSNYMPLISTDFYYYFNEKFVVKSHVSYGGYGKLNAGLAFAKSVSKYFDIFVGTNNIEAYIVPSSSYTNSGFIGLKAYFK